MVECLSACNIVAQKYNIGAPVKDPSHRSERLLARRVPNLHLYNFAFYFYDECAELDSNSHLIFFERAVHHSGQQVRLTHPCIADDNQFERIVDLLVLKVFDNFVCNVCDFNHN